MREDAVAPILAVLLILGVAVAFLGAWNSTTVPSWKAEAEIIHTDAVEEAFVAFSADVLTLATTKKDGMSVNRVVPLGGGSVIFDSTKSSGTVRIFPDNASVRPILMKAELTMPGGTKSTYDLRLLNVSYRPINNFWQNQGYVYEYGHVNVTKDTITTPLQYADMNAAAASPAVENLAGSFVDITNDTITLVSWNTTRSAAFASGNGNAVVSAEMKLVQKSLYENTTVINITTAPDGIRPAWFTALVKKDLEQKVQKTGASGTSDSFTLPGKDGNITLNRYEILFTVR